MSEQDNINTIYRLFDNLNKHDISKNTSNISEDYKSTAPGAMGEMDRQQSVEYTQGMFQAFPDLHFDLKDVIAQGDKVAVTWVARGTNTGPNRMPNGDIVPATNRTVILPGSGVYELRNGNVTRQDIYFDNMTALSQLGLLAGQSASSSASSR